MSIFDVIKYPISDYPTIEELKRLPRPIFDKWISRTKWQVPKDLDKGVAYMSGAYKLFTAHKDKKYNRVHPDVRLLRNMLKDNEEYFSN